MTRDEVMELKDNLVYAEKQLDNAQRTLDICCERMAAAQQAYRLAEVRYVLEKIHSITFSYDIPRATLNAYIAHCLNCLSGDVDGMVLDMSELVEELKSEVKK